MQRLLRKVALAGSAIGQSVRRCGYRLPQVNAARQSFVERRSAYPMVAARSGEARKLPAIDFNCAQIPFVFGALLKTRCPAAIRGFVVAHWVQSVNRVVFARALAHVLQKCGKRGGPTLANNHASGSIFAEVFMRCVGATALHSKPSSIGRRDESRRLVPMDMARMFSHVGCLTKHHCREQAALKAAGAP